MAEDRISSAFSRLNTSGNGLLTMRQLSADGMIFEKVIGFSLPPPDQVRSHWADSDVDGDGFLNLDEFVNFVRLCECYIEDADGEAPPAYGVDMGIPIAAAVVAVPMPMPMASKHEGHIAGGAGEITKLGVSFGGGDHDGHEYAADEIVHYQREIDQIFTCPLNASFNLFQTKIQEIATHKGGAQGLISVLTGVDRTHVAGWNVFFKTLEHDVCFLNYLLGVYRDTPASNSENILEHRDKFGHKLFHRAAEKGLLSHLKALADAGVDKQAEVALAQKGDPRKNAITVAKLKNHQKTVIFLRNELGVEDMQSGACVLM